MICQCLAFAPGSDIYFGSSALNIHFAPNMLWPIQCSSIVGHCRDSSCAIAASLCCSHAEVARRRKVAETASGVGAGKSRM
jgi:hypothetical protein